MTKLKLIVLALTLALLLPLVASGATLVPYTYGIRPHAATFNGALYLFYGTTYISTYGADWSAPATAPIPQVRLQTAGGPRPVEFNGRLYIFWLDTSSGDFYYMSMDQYGVWSTIVTKVPGGANGDWGPAMCTFNNRLYVMWRAHGTNTSAFYCSMGTDGVWSATAHLSTAETSHEPTAAVLNGADGIQRMWAFWKDRNDFGADQMWYASMPPGGAWSSTTRLNTPDYPLTETTPSVTSSGSRLYLTYKGGYNGDILVKQMDASNNWYEEQTVLGGVTDNPPSSVWFNGALWIFWSSNYDLQIYYQVFNL